MKYYIATKLENHAAHNNLRDWLADRGHCCTYDWTTHGPVFRRGLEVVRQTAEAETRGVIDADFVIVLWPGGRGTHVEMGMAIALNKQVMFYSPVDDHHAATQETCAFYHHPNVKRFSEFDCLLDCLRHIA
jgi:nucleoside 2-deoxyribosyltransferase